MQTKKDRPYGPFKLHVAGAPDSYVNNLLCLLFIFKEMIHSFILEKISLKCGDF